MITLLRNLGELPEPAGGYNQLPLTTDTTTMADLVRIKYYRNKLAHFKDGKIDAQFFTSAWEHISGVS